MLNLPSNLKVHKDSRVLCPCVDPAGAARSDPASGRSDSPAPGPAGATSADYNPAAPSSHHCRTEPGVTFSPVDWLVQIFNQYCHFLLSVFFPYVWSHRASRSVCRANRWHRLLTDRPSSISPSMQMARFCSRVGSTFSCFFCLPSAV